jgi:hypothetical protein
MRTSSAWVLNTMSWPAGWTQSATTCARGARGILHCRLELASDLARLGGPLDKHIRDEQDHIAPLLKPHITLAECDRLPAGDFTKLTPAIPGPHARTKAIQWPSTERSPMSPEALTR